jgi:hypothetical protein
VPKIFELLRVKKNSRVTDQAARESLFVEITGKTGIFAS